jgi:hypothetical protein
MTKVDRNSRSNIAKMTGKGQRRKVVDYWSTEQGEIHPWKEQTVGKGSMEES